MTQTASLLSQDPTPDLHPATLLNSHEEAIAAARELAYAACEGVITRDQKRQLPWELVDRFTRSGLGNISIPRAFGGPELPWATIAEVFRLISSVDPALGQIPQNQFGLIGLIRAAASEEQQARIFAGLLEGRRLANAGPERGSKHSLDIRARLTQSNGRHYLSGRKFYSTGALFAHWVTAKAVDDQGRQILAIIPRERAGLEVIDDWSGFGQRTTASGSVVLNRVEVDAESIIDLTSIGEQPNIQGACSQLIQAAIDAGIAEGALNDAIDFVRHRARPWVDAKVDHAGDDPYVIADVGRLQVDLHAAQALLDRAAAVLDEVSSQPIDADSAAQASIAVARAKVLTTEISLAASEKLLELAGSRATLAEFGLDRHWRNARTHTLHDPVRWKYHAIGAWELNRRHPARHSWI